MENKGKKRKRRLPVVIVIVLALIILGVLLWKAFGDKLIDYNGNAGDGTVMINGTKYEEIPNVDKYLIIGIDDYNSISGKDGDTYAAEYATTKYEKGHCDIIFLVAIDRVNNTYGVISINRDVLVNIPTYDEEGNITDTTRKQLEYAFLNGDTSEERCQSVEDSVSDLLYGLKINRRVAFDMSSVLKTNELLNGITIVVPEDMTVIDPALTEGTEITLSDSQVEKYIREAMIDNEADRQQVYIYGFRAVCEGLTSEDPEFADELYDGLANYISTDLSKSDFSKLAKAMMDNEYLETEIVEGTVSEDAEGNRQIEADPAGLEEALQLVYRKVE